MENKENWKISLLDIGLNIILMTLVGTCVFFLFHISMASAETISFEEYAVGELLDDNPWHTNATGLSVSDDYAWNGIKSMKNFGGSKSSAIYFATTTQLSTAFYLKPYWQNNQSFIYFSNILNYSDWCFNLFLYNDGTNIDIYFNNGFGTSTKIIDNASSSYWYGFNFYVENSKMTLLYNINGGTWNVASLTGNDLYCDDINNIYFPNTNTSINYYLDDITLYDFDESVEIIDLPENGTVSIIYDEDNPFKIGHFPEYCFINDQCNLTIGFFPTYDNNAVVTVLYEDTYETVATATLHSIINTDGFFTQNIPLIEETATGTIGYTIIIERPDDTNKIYSYDITWLSEEEEEAYWNQTVIAFQCNNIKNEQSIDACTESENWISCGLKKFVGWMVQLDEDTCYKLFGLAYYNQHSFPFDIIYTMTWLATSTEATTTSVIAPLKWYNSSTHTWDDTGVSLLSSDTLEKGMSSDLYEFYYTWFTRFIYLIGFGYITFRTIRILNKAFPSHIDVSSSTKHNN